ncbi:restriction endonuclease subunit S [Neisseria perflava]|uniref:restriction endonuclease subunit S n=1 Tax=Neisseria TaxID=482 RepID=UPI001902AD28|nr:MULTISPECIES: restriction endonuclease subunit S [Neisseria]MCL5079009.1 restriction endonuclease subunit S [Neisseria perflava]
MGGLEVREVQLSRILENKDGRFDTDFWIKEPILNPQLTYRRIGECLKVSQYGISIEMNEEGIGQPIYRMNEIHNMLCDFSVSKFAQVTNSEILKFKLNNRDVLFNRTNSFEWVGRTGIYYKQPNKDFIFASYLVRFVPDENIIIPEYLTAYLNSKYGIWDLKRRARQSINQTNINPEEVKEILIPILPIRFQLEIKSNFDKARDNFIESERVYQTAQNLLLEHLGLKDFNPPAQAVNIKSFADSFGTSGRLDAEFYQEKYDVLVQKLKAQEYDELKNLVSVKKSIEPGSSAYDEQGLPFIRVSDYDKFQISSPAKYLSEAYCQEYCETLKNLQPKKGTILFSKDGTVGIAHLLSEDLSGITSGAILHLKVKDKRVLPEYLTLVLNSLAVQWQAERDVGGSIIQHWRIEEIKEVVIPIISMETQTQIADLIRQSDRLRQESQALLEEAKRKVEQAIEG